MVHRSGPAERSARRCTLGTRGAVGCGGSLLRRRLGIQNGLEGSGRRLRSVLDAEAAQHLVFDLKRLADRGLLWCAD